MGVPINAQTTAVVLGCDVVGEGRLLKPMLAARCVAGDRRNNKVKNIFFTNQGRVNMTTNVFNMAVVKQATDGHQVSGLAVAKRRTMRTALAKIVSPP